MAQNTVRRKRRKVKKVEPMEDVGEKLNNLEKQLLRKKIVDKKLLTNLKAGLQPGETLETALLKNKLMVEEELMAMRASLVGINAIDLFSCERDDNSVEYITKELAQQKILFPISQKGNILEVAMADPLNYDVRNELRLLTNSQILPLYAPAADINLMIANHYPTDFLQVDWDNVRPKEEVESKVISEESANSPIVKLVESLLKDAVDRNASDIHFDSQEFGMVVRVRIDGELIEINRIPKNAQQAVISRLKIIAELDISESRLPQDGRAQIQHLNKRIDLRVSALPTIHGEKIVIRIMDTSVGVRSLEEFHFNRKVLKKVQKILHQPHGLFLVTGPTGSGKSSTLYASMNELNTTNLNLITVEDPVEFQMEGINQVQVNSNIGLTFASGLRSILRQDPNIVMIGEIRDKETAEIAIRASLTGHLVLSTLHTNDAVSTVNRLLDMGVDPFLVSNSLAGVLSQRLVRTICSNCKVKVEISQEDKQFIEGYWEVPTHTYKGTGCQKCGLTGYKGRMAIQELLELSVPLKTLVSQSAEEHVLRGEAEAAGMINIMKDGLEKVVAGHTTIQEVLRVAMSE